MDYEAILAQALELLQREKRLSYRGLKRRLQLDDDILEDLKEDLIYAKRLAVDEEGKVLVWSGGEAMAAPPARDAATSSQPTERTPQLSPIVYTPRHLAERILAEQAALEARGASDGERKTITALFADIKGSMDLLEDLDPEDARRIIDPALQLMMEAVHRYEGYVAQSLGDGILALFGAPIAHEDHAHRALYAALRMQEAAKRYADTLRREYGLTLHIRVGLNTGEVVMRSIQTDDLHTDYVPIGHSTSLAARMESLAAPGSIPVSEHTFKLTEGYFEFNALGAAQVKGVSEPVHVYEVLGVGPLRTRLQVAARRGLARFVGRQRELEQMRRALDLAKAGHGQIVAIVGEPGVGKSRLCYEFKCIVERSCLVLETFSVSHSRAYPYLPLVELLKSYFHITPQDDERRRREQVTGKVLTLDRSLEGTLPYLLALLGVSEPAAALAQMDPQIRRWRTFEAITRLLLRESLNQPLLMLIEDLHWLDSETQVFLNGLCERLATAHVLLVTNYRPEAELQGLLAQLQAKELLYEQPAFPEPEYTFKHALTQEVAYHSLLLERRRLLHERTAQALEALFPDRLEEYASELAHHYRQSGNTAKAVEYLQRAGRQAMQRSAYAKAVAHLTTALTLLEALPDTLGAPAAGAGPADDARPGLDGDKGLCNPGGGTHLCQGPGTVRAGGGDGAAAARTARAAGLLFRAGGAWGGAGARRAAAQPGPTPVSPTPPAGGPMGAGGHRVLPGGVGHGPRPP
jgi:class 3 adenylate cyclase